MAQTLPQPNIPSFMRTVPGSVNIPVASFPHSGKALESSPLQVATQLVDSLNNSISKANYKAIADLFYSQGYWRDHLALTWDFHTSQGPMAIEQFLKDAGTSRNGFRLKRFALDTSNTTRAPQNGSIDKLGEVQGISFFISLETTIGTGSGVVRMIQDRGTWKIFTIYTRLDEIKGVEEGIYENRPNGVQHGGIVGRKNWADRRKIAENFEDSEPAVFILGAGQAGLTAAARLKMLGIEAIVIDKNDRVGDNWRKRYHQLVLHDPVWYDHLPYLNFPPQWPVFTPKDKLAQFFESYAQLLELNVWTKTEMTSCSYDDKRGEWTIQVKRTLPDGSSQTRTFHPRHVIQATGHSGKKNMPDMKGIENFKGNGLWHSSEFKGAREGVPKGTKAVVVGSCNSAHDIAQDFMEKGYDVTIVQRSTTHVVSSSAIVNIGLKGSYMEGGPNVDDADLLLHSYPSQVLKAIQIQIAKLQKENDKEILEGLAKVGFKTDDGPDGAGLFIKYFQRGGGYYIDVGASSLIAQGKIKVKQGQEIDTVLPNGLKFADGSILEADEIVFATGYQNMRSQTRLTFGDDVADRVSDVWGFNDEGEMRVMWQKSGHPGFWFHGGNLALCRYFSKLLALQIAALEKGIVKYGEK